MQYYLQRSEGGYVGNCLLWWRKGGHGYTCDLKEAEVFDEGDTNFRQILTYEDGMKHKKYTAWEKNYIDSCASLFVDHQNLNLTLSGVDNGLLIAQKLDAPAETVRRGM